MRARCQILVPYRPYSGPGRCEKTINVETAKIPQKVGKAVVAKICRRHKRMLTEGKPLTIAP